MTFLRLMTFLLGTCLLQTSRLYTEEIEHFLRKSREYVRGKGERSSDKGLNTFHNSQGEKAFGSNFIVLGPKFL